MWAGSKLHQHAPPAEVRRSSLHGQGVIRACSYQMASLIGFLPRGVKRCLFFNDGASQNSYTIEDVAPKWDLAVNLSPFKWPHARLRAEAAASMSGLRRCWIRALGGRLCGGVQAAISPRSDPLRVVLRFFYWRGSSTAPFGSTSERVLRARLTSRCLWIPLS